MTIFATLTPIDPGTNSRVTVRVCAMQDQEATGAAGERWWPALSSLPVIRQQFFDGDFTSAVEPATASIEILLDVLMDKDAFPGVERYDWAGASCRLQRLSNGVLVDVQDMQVESFASKALVLGLRLKAAGPLYDAQVLKATYAGTTGAEGTADLKGQFKPWIFGRALNVEPVQINQVDSVFQVSGYGPVQAIAAVYERGASFGASTGDFATYDALVAATIPPGRWATCLAQGMFRLGAPPNGVITCDVDGDNAGGFLRLTGAILSNIAGRIGLTGKVNAASMIALDTAVPRTVNIVIRDQISFLELAQRMLAPCNAVGSVGSDGRLIASRVAFGTEQFTLDAQGREMPPVLNMERQNTSAPYKLIKMGAARSWRVHSFDEIAFYADLIDRGTYDPSTVYREGNIVTRTDKSRWLYINPVAASGNAPPNWPTLGNDYWQAIEGPASLDPNIRNTAITVTGGVISGIGTADVPVDNRFNMLTGTRTSLPATGDFVGQQRTIIDTGEVVRWGGTAWTLVSDITVLSERQIIPQFPSIEIRQGEPGNTGNRAILHSVQRGSITLVGGTWSLPASNLGGGGASINTSTGTVTLSGIVQSGTYTIRYVHTDGIATEEIVNVTFIGSGGTSTTSDGPVGLSNITGTSFSPITFRELQVTLPTGVTAVNLTAPSVNLEVEAALPLGPSGVEARWMVSLSGSGTWSAVGSTASSSPSPETLDSGLVDAFGNTLPYRSAGQITCNRTASGLTAGSTYKFRLEGRIASGITRTIYVSGTGSAST